MAPAIADSSQILLTRKQAAARLAISESHLKNLTIRGVVKCINLGRSVRYQPSELSLAVVKLAK